MVEPYTTDPIIRENVQVGYLHSPCPECGLLIGPPTLDGGVVRSRDENGNPIVSACVYHIFECQCGSVWTIDYGAPLTTITFEVGIRYFIPLY